MSYAVGGYHVEVVPEGGEVSVFPTMGHVLVAHFPVVLGKLRHEDPPVVMNQHGPGDTAIR